MVEQMQTAQVAQLGFQFWQTGDDNWLVNFNWLPIQKPDDFSGTIEERFEAFHTANPHVYAALRRLALGYRRAGQEHCGMKMLYEVLRYQSGIHTKGDPYTLNNNFTALYARKMMAEEPELAGFFELRERRAD